LRLFSQGFLAAQPNHTRQQQMPPAEYVNDKAGLRISATALQLADKFAQI